MLLGRSRIWVAVALAFLAVGCAHTKRTEEATRPARFPASLEQIAALFEGMPRPSVPPSFRAAKKTALKLYAGHRRTFYCGCDFDASKRVEPERCGYIPRKINRRAKRIEWEHIVPAAAFGRHRPCWIKRICRKKTWISLKGRKCCRTIDPVFRAMEADLHNLVPAVGELNGDRSNYPYGDVPDEPRQYGRCDFEVDRDAGVAEPAVSLRGDVARTYLYMHFAYPGEQLPLSAHDLARFMDWNNVDPPDAWERERDALVSAVQGTGNPLVWMNAR